MRKIIVMLPVLVGVFAFGSAKADCPRGQSLDTLSGNCKPSADAKTYAQCVRDGRAVGYSAADVEVYCKRVYSK